MSIKTEQQSFTEHNVNNNEYNYEYDYILNRKDIETKNNNCRSYENQFSEEIDKTNTIYNLVELMFKQKILPIKDKFNNYNFSITGAIGSGKSTLLEILNKLFIRHNFKINAVPEYLGIDKELGGILLDRRIKNKLSNTTFQNYIMDQYVERLSSNGNSKYDICLFERLPDDSILCFSNISNYDNYDLTNFDLFVLDKRMKSIVERYNIPSYRDNNTKFKKLTSGDLTDLIAVILDLIVDDINKGVKNRIIGLDVAFELTKERIIKRNRQGENGYTDEYLNRIINFYSRLYNLMNEDRNKLCKFTCIGQLVEI
jgi:deoxyadenosine/deoxycytidine kinase